ncbi:MAG: ribosome silencing factor [Planctomycetaceae bacterium]|jgi:ribosome-associated protein|nr:ribosome silencing factor [Planctomycetaceae bacterium]
MKIKLKNILQTTTSSSSSSSPSFSALERLSAAVKVVQENRGNDIVVLDVRELTKAFDYFLIVSGTSRRQLNSMGDEIQKKLVGEMEDECLSVSGYKESRWIVIDYGDIIVHLFEPETRNFYAIEELWGKAIKIPLDSPLLNCTILV